VAITYVRLVCFILSLILFHKLESQSYIPPSNPAELKQFIHNTERKYPKRLMAVFDSLITHYDLKNQKILYEITLLNKAEKLIALNKTDEARNILILLEKKENGMESYSMAFIYKLLGQLEYLNGKYYVAVQLWKKAMEFAKVSKDDTMIASIQEDFGKLFEKINRTDRSITFYLRSWKLNKQLNNFGSLQSCALALGRLYQQTHQLDSALFFIRQSISISDSLKIQTSLCESLIELANFYLKTKNYNLTKEILNQIDSLVEIENSEFLQVRKYVLKGNFAMFTEGDSTAMHWYKKALDYSHQGFTVFIDNYIKSNIAESYHSIGKTELAYEYLKDLSRLNAAYANKENDQLAEELNQNTELHIRDREIEFLKIQNQLKQQHLQRQEEIRRSLQRENSLKDQTLDQEQLLNQANTRQQQLQLDKQKSMSQALLRENEFKKAALHDEHRFRLILYAGIAILLFLGVLIFILFNKQKEKNEIILKQTRDLEFINKEVHHRVKNNLQVISSILDLQSQTNQDSSVRNLLKESKHRVQSMAFIHQNLYEGPGLNLVDMPSYVQNLADHLATTYHHDHKTIELSTRITPMRLHMDTVVSIGMIINELITNALKYAFIDRNHGLIEISLKEFQSSIVLTVSDNGIGIAEDIDVYSIKSFGYKMIRAFVQKLKAKLIIENMNGTKVQIIFEKRS
jgi:two-component system, sensor histidine kinase PdtaS